VGVGAVIGQRRDVAHGTGKPGDDQKILVAPDQRRHRLAPVEHEARRRGRCGGARGGLGFHGMLPQKRFAPTSFCGNSTGTARGAWNTIVSGAVTVARASAGSSARRHFTPIASSTGTVAWPIGYCHGLPSPKSPRMLTSMRNGKRPPLISESMLTQLPTPLL